ETQSRDDGIGHLAPRRLFGDRIAGQPRVEPDRAQLAVAPDRAETAEAGGTRGVARGNRGARRAARTRETCGGTESRTRTEGTADRPDPLHRSPGRWLQTLRSDPAAGRAGGAVLPDGRLRLDDRAHERPRQAVLHPALYLSETPLQECRRGVHPPYT